jgi:hypothetical protein
VSDCGIFASETETNKSNENLEGSEIFNGNDVSDFGIISMVLLNLSFPYVNF